MRLSEIKRRFDRRRGIKIAGSSVEGAGHGCIKNMLTLAHNRGCTCEQILTRFGSSETVSRRHFQMDPFMSFRHAMLHSGSFGACFVGEMPADGAAFESAARFTPTSVTQPRSANGRVSLQNGSKARIGYGHLEAHRAPVVFTSASLLDLSNANAAITPHPGGDAALFGDLKITIPDAAFTDLIFSLSMADTDAENGPSLTISAFDGPTEVGSTSFMGLRRNQETTLAIVATWGALTRVELASSTGIKEARDFEISGVAASFAKPTWAAKILRLPGIKFAKLC